MLHSLSHSTSRDSFQLPQFVLPRPFSWRIEFPLPQIPGFAANAMRTVPFATRATLLAMLCPVPVCGSDASAARTARAVLAIDVMREFVIC
jgi:hypothetical protein